MSPTDEEVSNLNEVTRQSIYRMKRDRNNQSVRKSRERKKREMDRIKKQIKVLTEQNESLKLHCITVKASFDELNHLYSLACESVNLEQRVDNLLTVNVTESCFSC